MREMISVAEADERIAAAMPACPSERVLLDKAQGRILREDLFADRDLPPFDRVTMDGAAFAYAAFEAGRRRFALAGVQKAGEPAKSLPDSTHCFEVMTGATLPVGCDTVVRVEDLDLLNGLVSVRAGAKVGPMQNIHRQGSDRRRGEVLLQAGQRLHAPAVAVAASVGKAEVLVARPPRVAIVSTGDELVDVADSPEPHQIRRSNDYALAAALRARRVEHLTRFHAVDDRERLSATLAEALASSDLLILTGGVSMGRFDYVPAVLQALGVKEVFHKVRQRPGKPLWFGVRDVGQPVFALPGNPVSAVVCLFRYVLPHVERAMGLTPAPPARAALTRRVEFNPRLTYFLPVRLAFNAQGRLDAEPAATNTSGDFTALGGTQGFMELDEDRDLFEAGEAAPVYWWD